MNFERKKGSKMNFERKKGSKINFALQKPQNLFCVAFVPNLFAFSFQIYFALE